MTHEEMPSRPTRPSQFSYRTMYACLAGGIALATALGACAASEKSSPFPPGQGGPDAGQTPDGQPPSLIKDSGGDSTKLIPPPTADCGTGLESVSVTPSTSSFTMPYSATPAPVTVTLKAEGKFKDGTTQDITKCAVWTVTPSGPTVTGGAFSTTTAGVFTVTVAGVSATDASAGISGTATVTVKLTGSVNLNNVATTPLDGTPSGAPPTVAYPIDGALFPLHFGDLGFQVVPPSATYTTGRIAFAGDAISLDVYGPCTPIANATLTGACSIAIPAALEADLAGVSEAPSLTETVRLSDGTHVVESASMSVRWAPDPLVGSIYYWSTPPSGGGGAGGASEIIRMNLAAPGTPPEVFLTNTDVIPYAPGLSGGWACIGCHAISQDGSKLAITIGGASVQPDGNGSFFALLDVANKVPLAAAIDDTTTGQFLPGGFAELTTFSPNAGDYMVQELQGQLFVRTSDNNLTSTGPLFSTITESLTTPSWSYNGDLLAFTSWVPTLSIPHAYDSKDENGNETPEAQIWTAPASITGTSAPTFGTPKLLVPRVTGATEYYPAISEDSALVVFNESSCNGPSSPSNDGYGGSPCDSYDDPSGRLRLVAAGGGTPVELDNASQRTSGWPASSTWTNSWPRFAPPAPSGSPPATFQGKSLYWIAFSSRHPYGATLAGSQDGTTPPQIWFAAIVVDPTKPLSGDPSFAPVWLPQQNSATPEILLDGGTSQTLGGDGTPTGNHVPQWVYTYVPYKPPPPVDGGYPPPPPTK